MFVRGSTLADENLPVDSMPATPKFHVVLDTNIYRKNPKRKGLAFLALERLAKAGSIHLHLPYIVEREFQTQQVAQYKKEFDAAIGGLESLIKKGAESAHIATLDEMLATLRKTAPAVLAYVEQALPNWVAKIGGSRHAITEEQATLAMEAYFRGAPPLKAPKVRDDIPDSFIYQVIADLAKKRKPLTVIAEDEKIAQASELIEGVDVYRSLIAFIDSAPVQAELIELDIVSNLPSIIEMIQSYEDADQEITSLLRHNGGEAILWKKVHSRSIPDDNHEATITCHYAPEDIELDFDELSYYGNGEFGLPYTFLATVSITYYIFKADYFALDEDELPSVTEHNDHYYEAEEDREVRVSGLVKLTFATAALESLSAENIDEHIDIEIDSVDEVSLEDDE